MGSSHSDAAFAGSIPEIYERYLVPLIFEPYALDIAARAARRQPGSVLEIAAGTGAVTRQLAQTLSKETAIVATDLSAAMLKQAAAAGTARPVEWREADAMRLPFPDGTFDTVVCQFGVMFFPDKAKAYAEAARVLRPGGQFIFNVWDRLEHNELADTVTQALAAVFSEDPPRFMPRVPHGYHDFSLITQDLQRGGFVVPPQFTTLAARSVAGSAQSAAIAYCQGTPLRSEIEARGAARLTEATRAAEEAIAQRFGHAAIDAKVQAHIVSVALES